MILGAGILQLPAIVKAKQMGYEVVAVDMNPQAIGFSSADIKLVISTIDVEKVVEAAKKYQVIGVMTLASDLPMRTVAAVAKTLGLSGIAPETAFAATDKGEMIKIFQEQGVEHPWFYIVQSEKELYDIKQKFDYPCIIKPTDNSGSRGVHLVNNESELIVAYNYSKQQSRKGRVVIEEYLRGPEVSVEIIVCQGEVHVIQVTDKLTTGAPHFVEMGHNQPSRLDKNDIIKISDLATRAVKAIGIDNSAAHVEIILTKDGPKMVELGARMGGDCITTHLVPLSTGVDMLEATIKLACGDEPKLESKFNQGSAIRFLNVPMGTIINVEGIDEAKGIEGVKQIFLTKNVGDIVGEIGSSTDRVGFVIAQANTAEEAINICEQAIKKIKFTVK